MATAPYSSTLHDRTIATASKRGAVWTKAEDDVLRTKTSATYELFDAAVELGRTFGATVQRYYIVKRHDRQGLSIDYPTTPREDASIRPLHNNPRHLRLVHEPCACAMAPEHLSWCSDYIQQSA